MPVKKASRADALMPDQLRVLNELSLFGGMQIVRHRRDHIHYQALEKKSFLRATELSRNEIRYNITSSGRAILHAIDGSSILSPFSASWTRNLNLAGSAATRFPISSIK